MVIFNDGILIRLVRKVGGFHDNANHTRREGLDIEITQQIWICAKSDPLVSPLFFYSCG